MKAMRKLNGMEDPGVRAFGFGGGVPVAWPVSVELGAEWDPDWRAMLGEGHGRERDGR